MTEYAILVWWLLQGTILLGVSLFLITNTYTSLRSLFKGLFSGFIKYSITLTRYNAAGHMIQMAVSPTKTINKLMKVRRVYFKDHPLLFLLKLPLVLMTPVFLFAGLVLTIWFSYYSYQQFYTSTFQLPERALEISSVFIYGIVVLFVGLVINLYIRSRSTRVSREGIQLGVVYKQKKAADKRFSLTASLLGARIPWFDIKKAQILVDERFEGTMLLQIETDLGTTYRKIVGEKGIDDEKIAKIEEQVAKYSN